MTKKIKVEKVTIGPVTGEGKTRALAQLAALTEAAAVLAEVERGPVFVELLGETRLACRESGGWMVYRVKRAAAGGEQAWSPSHPASLATMCQRSGTRAQVDAALRVEVAQALFGREPRDGYYDYVDRHPLFDTRFPKLEYSSATPGGCEMKEARREAGREYARWARWQHAYAHYHHALTACYCDPDHPACRLLLTPEDVASAAHHLASGLYEPSRYGVAAWVDDVSFPDPTSTQPTLDQHSAARACAGVLRGVKDGAGHTR